MEVETSGVAISQDASFIKDADLEREVESTVQHTITADGENVAAIKTSQADCSTTSITEKVIEEKDDLLAQIEEVCNNKVSNLETSEDISKSSENEFFRKIEEMEIKSLEVNKNDKSLPGDLAAKDTLKCESSNIDAVIVGDKVLLVKEDSQDKSGPKPESTKPEDVGKSPGRAEELFEEEECEISVNTEVPRKEAVVSSSTSNAEVDLSLGNSCVDTANIPKETCSSKDLKSGDEKMQVDVIEPIVEKMDVDREPPAAEADTKVPEKIAHKQDEVNDTTKKDENIEKPDSSKIDVKGVQLANDKDVCESVETPIVEDSANKKCDLMPKENTVSSSLTGIVSSTNICRKTLTHKPSGTTPEKVMNLCQAEKEDTKITQTVSETATSDTHSSSETNQTTAEKNIDAANKFNGIADTTTDEEDKKNRIKSEEIECPEADAKKESMYEINISLEQNDIRYLSVKRLDLVDNRNECLSEKASENSVRSSSNGNVSDLPAYSLHPLEENSTSASTTSLKNSNPQNSYKKETLSGIEELCNFMINQFTSIKRSINPGSYNAVTMAEADEILTPIQHTKKNTKNSPALETPSTPAGKTKRSRKRSTVEDELEENSKPKQAKRDVTKEISEENRPENDEMKTGPCVLAKWIDKKFYAGKITAEKSGNKYVVLFEDGASKTLPKESIVFGEGEVLPLKDQQIYALVDEDYEIGTVLSIEKSSSKTHYVVKTDKVTVKVTASDIYLDVEQAKEIQKLQNLKVSECFEEGESSGTRPSRNKRPPVSPSTPEAGYSGAIAKRGGKRQKRLPFISAPILLPDGSDSSDALESTPPASPKQIEGLELVEGVQPELQNTPNDSELFRMLFISDYEKTHPEYDVDELLGPLPKLNALFRNKHILLTCTVGLRPHRFFQERTDDAENNRFKQFSAVPYVKHHLQKQLEAGGATVYRYFEDVPKSKYKQCKLIAPRPCLTAKYVQCLASNIQAVSHDWVIESCRQQKLVEISQYYLPAGWSILNEAFVQWKSGKQSNVITNPQPFAKTHVLIAGEHSDFVDFWGRVCKAAGAKLGFIKTLGDIKPKTTGYMVTESDFSHAIKSKAINYGIPVVSTVWVVQSLINGVICPTHTHPRLLQAFEDDEVEKWSLSSDNAS